jgi:hypothetical protein
MTAPPSSQTGNQQLPLVNQLLGQLVVDLDEKLILEHQLPPPRPLARRPAALIRCSAQAPGLFLNRGLGPHGL